MAGTSVDAREDNRDRPSPGRYEQRHLHDVHHPGGGYCHRLQGQLDREGITYDVVDIERDPSAAEIVMTVNNGNQTVPTLVYSDGAAHTNPSIRQVKEKLAAIA